MKLALDSLTVRYRTGSRILTAVDSIDLVVPEGQTVGLVGESGSGKSTVARAIVGLVPITSGRLLLDDIDRTRLTKKNVECRRRVQMVFQDPYSSLNHV